MLHKCGFCQGSDSFAVPPNSVLAPVRCALGRGTVYVEEPTVTCAFCRGTGVQPTTYPYALLTCAACMGKGVATLKEPSRLC